MLDEVAKIMDLNDKDASIIWKASVMHHMMFGLHYGDYTEIVDKLLPLAQRYKYDLFINGHEHQMNYAYVEGDKQVHQT